MSQIEEYIGQYRDALLHDVIPFWEKYSRDPEGGYFTCLNREGQVFDTDKFIWLQARQVWTFAMLYNRVEQKESWQQFAEHGAQFLLKNGRDRYGNWYFSLNRSGSPLVEPYNIFSDCFAAMAFHELSLATGNREYLQVALDSLRNILKRQKNPKGKYNKSCPGTRDLSGFALPMILAGLSHEMQTSLDATLHKTLMDDCIQTVMHTFYDPEADLVLESVGIDGSLSDSFDGRLINPGHAIEAMWFVMDIAQRTENTLLAQTACQRALRMLEYGWDPKYRGIFYFMDRKGHPPQQLEWDQKLWWVHLEALVALLKAFRITGLDIYWQWFETVHTYTWDHFPDPEIGEWFGYLNRRGEPILDLKGGKWKGCFHVPRALLLCWKTLEELREDTN